MGRKSARSRGVGYWAGIVEEWRQSGMAQKTFCLEKQLSYSAFYYWYRKLAEFPPDARSEEKSAGRDNPKLTLDEVVLVETERGSSPGSLGDGQGNCYGAACYEISLCSNRRICLGADFEEAVLVRLVRVLENC